MEAPPPRPTAAQVAAQIAAAEKALAVAVEMAAQAQARLHATPPEDRWHFQRQVELHEAWYRVRAAREKLEDLQHGQI